MAGCDSRQNDVEHKFLNNAKVLSRSSDSNSSDISPFDFGAKIYDFGSSRWVHSGFDSYQLIPLQTEYNAIAAIRNEVKLYKCVQYRLNVHKRAYDSQYSFNITLISENEDSFATYVNNNLFCRNDSTAPGFTGFEIFTNISSNNVVASNYYANGELIKGASLYTKAQSLEDNTDDIIDVLYGLGIYKEINTDFNYSNAVPDICFYDRVHHEDCSYNIMINGELNTFRCLCDWIEPNEPDTQDHECSEDGGSNGGSIYIPPVIPEYNWKYDPTDRMCKGKWFENSKYPIFIPYIFDVLSYTGLYFNFDCPPKYYFETNANRLNPILVSESDLAITDLENLLALYYTYSESESIMESIDNGHPCILSIDIDNNGKANYTLCIGYTNNKKAIYFNPYINKLESREIDTIDSGIIYSITGKIL